MTTQPTRRRDDFAERVKRVAAERAAHLCCNPTCRSLTIAPHTDPNKSLNTGNAGHIHAAAPEGPRYDQSQTEEERKSIGNAIWLCATCHRKVDGDESKHTAEVLLGWRQKHEAWISEGGILPRLPELELMTLHGHAIPDVPGTVTMEDAREIREHSLILKNCADTPIATIEARIQLPEPVVKAVGKVRPAGVTIVLTPIREEMRFSGGPGAQVVRERPPLATNLLALGVDSLAPSQEIELRLFTSLEQWRSHDLSFTGGVWAGMNDPPNTMRFIDGTFQYELHGATLAKGFFAPIQYDGDSREMGLVEVRGDYGEWKPGKLFSWS